MGAGAAAAAPPWVSVPGAGVVTAPLSGTADSFNPGFGLAAGATWNIGEQQGVRFDYAMAMGVRYGEREWKQQVEGLLESQRAEIQAILREFGVPLVDEPPAAR